jgi:hypothetical protein
MNFTTLPSEWINVGVGNWTASGTSLTPTSTALNQELERVFPTNLSNYLAETTFTFTALELNGSAILPFRMDNQSNGWRCVVNTLNGAGSFFTTQVTGGAGEPTQPPSIPISNPQPGSKYRVLGGAYNNSIYCMLGTGERQSRTSSSSSSSGDSGIRAAGAAARFDYLLIYQLGGTIP